MGPIDAPLVTYDPAARCWKLLEEYVVWDGVYAITLRAPFSFDLASVPRWFWALLGPHELGIVGPLCHDRLYRCGGDLSADISPGRTYTRLETDVLFLALMRKSGVGRFRRSVAYLAVRLFGARSWRK